MNEIIRSSQEILSHPIIDKGNFVFWKSHVRVVDFPFLGEVNGFGLEVSVVRNVVQEMLDAIQTGMFLDVRGNVYPRRNFRVCVEEHSVFHFGIIRPIVERLDVHGTELPPFHRGIESGSESLELNIRRNGEPVLEKNDTISDEKSFERGCCRQETAILLIGTESHYRFHSGSVVPAPVEKNHLTSSRKMGDVPLEVPLSGFSLGRGRESCNSAESGCQMFCYSFDHATFSSGVTSFEHNCNSGTSFLCPNLHLNQLLLQFVNLFVVFLSLDFLSFAMGFFGEHRH